MMSMKNSLPLIVGISLANSLMEDPKWKKLDKNWKREDDFQRCWIQNSWNIKGFAMGILKWQPDFKFEEDQPVVPIWVALHDLPIEFLNPQILFYIATGIRKPVQVDTPTLNLTRPSVAHFCVEVDLTKQKGFLATIKIGKKGKKYEQAFTYEYVPFYCDHCRKIGHMDSACRQKHFLVLEHDGKKFKDARELIDKKKAKPSQPLTKSRPRVLLQENANPSSQAALLSSDNPSSSGLSQKEKDAIVVDIENSPPKQLEKNKVPLEENSERPKNSTQKLVSQPATVAAVVAPPVAASNMFAIPETIQEEDGEIRDDRMDFTVLNLELPVLHEKVNETLQQEGFLDESCSDMSRQEEESQALQRLDSDTPLTVGQFHDDAEIGKQTERLDVVDGDHACWLENDVDRVRDQEATQAEVSESQKGTRKTKAEMMELRKEMAPRRSSRLQ
ncbi:OLC1v1018742C1 [Oldenlandia corymbosa var. corymbosa]|uniref:OLC1v1018742C1 n=1 Tax=Oldenlandia corymbosa var. corymbosa TaxID=529605 RepID=A0AAV1ECE1_OLDCO|nr:OLC1v1018742C1 [Oldenlandia corymbosa var. corymbosa]